MIGQRFLARCAIALGIISPSFPANAYGAGPGGLIDHPAQGVRLAEGFEIAEIAGPELANDIWAMTFDARGRIVVSGPGYIRILHDSNGDGIADDATLFAKHPGAMGLCFNETGTELLAMGGGSLTRFHDANQDGVADGPAENILPFASGEHGGHAIRQGPDGWWYVIGGNDAGIDTRHNTAARPVVGRIEAGALLRLSPDLKQSEVIAHGFRNPYDFDFNAAGDAFTFDSDTERDYFLPWYSPCRIYQVQFAQHHGWRLKGFQRSLRRSNDYPDVAPALVDIGRGSPTGVVCYRHVQFPDEFRGGVFACDWTFGRIHFIGLAAEGAGYSAKPRVFLEPIGTHGFAPTDCAVAPDGSLIVTIGGRKTRGAVYRITHRKAREMTRADAHVDEVGAVLRARQPLDAWSRAMWMPIARRLGAGPFEQALRDSSRALPERLRAVEVLTELFDGCGDDSAAMGVETPEVVARMIWSASRRGQLMKLDATARVSSDALVRAAAAEAAVAVPATADGGRSIDLQSLGSEDRRVRNAAISALTTALRAHANGWQTTTAKALSNGDRAPKVELALIRARLVSPLSGVAFDELKETIGILEQAENDDVRFEAVRLVQLCLGDWRVDSPSAEAFSAYESRFDLRSDDSLRTRLLRAVRPLIGRSRARVNEECARVCAMLHDDDSTLGETILGVINGQSSATSDFHFLAVLARLDGVLKPPQAPATAAAIIGLDRKLAGGDQRPKQNWSVRLAELVEALVKRQPLVADALLQTPDFATAARLSLVPSLGPSYVTDAARLYFSAAKDDPHFEWSPALMALLRKLPGAEVDSLIKAHGIAPPVAHAVSAEETARWEKLLDTVAWERGDAKRGEKIFRERTCAGCHGAAVSIGPDLAGAARRFAPRDLLRAIVFPSRDIAEPYRATTFTLRDGTVRQGIVVFLSADGVIVQTAAGLTERIAENEIISRETSPLSLMPAGLLEGVSANDLADLHAYLKQL